MFGIISQKKSRSILTSVGLLAGLAVGAVASTADAAVTTPTSVAVVEYYNGTLLVQLAGAVNYYGQLATQAGCTANNQTVDTLKAWQSLSQAALLSGKQLKLYFNTCNGVNYISAMDLNS